MRGFIPVVGILFLYGICFASASHGITTGEGLYSLYFPGGGGLELQTGAPGERTLSQILPTSFTFECWAMLPNAADGTYKSITSRWDRGASGFHNRWADWNFQVQSSGDLNFFMGNGEISSFGFLMTPISFPSNRWTHVAFTVYTLPGGVTPQTATIVVNGIEVARQNWLEGIRQERRNRPIYIGDYFNQDLDHKWWKGYLDEIRFWGIAKTSSDIQTVMNRVVPANTANLLAYYRLNEGAGMVVTDETSPQYNGRLSTGSGSPQWKVSGAKIHVDKAVDSESVTTFLLPGLSAAGALSFNYIIRTLPTTGELLHNGIRIREVPYTLTSNEITFRAPATRGVPTSFRYFGARQGEPDEVVDAIVFIQVGEAPCVVDACGRCGGDGSTCTCLALPYNGYNLADLERILLLYEIEQTLDLMTQLEGKLESTMRTLATSQVTDLQVIIDEVQIFNSQCLVQFCQKVDKYIDQLAAISN